MRVGIELTEEAFAFYNTGLKKWTVEKGVYRIKVGSSSRKHVLCVEKEVKSNDFITNEGQFV